MAGFWHLSSTMMFDELGVPAPGAQAYFYAAAVLDELAVYKDSSLTTKWNQPVTADGFGRMPNVYLDDTAASYYRFRVTSAQGVELIALASIPINAGSGGGGGGSGVDPTTIFSTGFVMWGLSAQQIAGFVRLNDRTIGSATSGAVERANADCNALFLYLWNNFTDVVCPVSTGRGASAAADWAANKNIGLPNMRGNTAFGVDGMGNVLNGKITASTTATPDTPGTAIGGETVTLVAGNLPPHAHTLPTTVAVQSGAGTNVLGTAGAGNNSGNGPGASTPANKMPWGKLGTWYIKL